MQPTSTLAGRLTADDYRTTPDATRLQLVDGTFFPMSPAPNRLHQQTVGQLYRLIADHVDAFHLGTVYVAPIDVYLTPHDVYQPDVLFVSTAHRDRLADDGIHGAPDLVIEVLSPATAQLDKTTKRAVYARTGVAELWLVDPLLRMVHRYDFAVDQAKAVQILDEPDSFTTPLLPGLSVHVAALFVG